MTRFAPTLSDQSILRTSQMPTPFALDPSAEHAREVARRFAEDVVKPKVLELDLADADDFDWDVIRQGNDAGLLRLVIPEAYGGQGLGVTETAITIEEISVVCPGVALVFGATMLAQTGVLLSGDPALMARFLPMFLSDEPVLACNAVTEDAAGCDLLIEENMNCAQEVMTARRDGDGYRLTGVKKFITNGKVARWVSVFACLEDAPVLEGLTAFVVPLDSAGVTRGEVADKMGYRACLGTTLHFDDVWVPAANVIAGEGGGAAVSRLQTNQARVSVAALSTGVARGAFEMAKAFCADRFQGGARLKDHQFSARKLAQMATKIEASRLMYLHAAHQADNILPGPTFGPAAAKLFADQTAIEVANDALSLMGARGYCREYGLEKLVRDAFGARIYEGTPEVLALDITRELYAGEVD
ncbi:acyl-CoA dehydrogenase family protein [Mycolicibacterium litorale]|uniref:acyl-CoA dehydrogenase family protein n=1 Tax=Mycolicibacterium litorale TaxID=758802 RepID=UPI003CEF8282